MGDSRESIGARDGRVPLGLLRAVRGDRVVGGEGAVGAGGEHTPTRGWHQPLCASLEHGGLWGRAGQEGDGARRS